VYGRRRPEELVQTVVEQRVLAGGPARSSDGAAASIAGRFCSDGGAGWLAWALSLAVSRPVAIEPDPGIGTGGADLAKRCALLSASRQHKLINYLAKIIKQACPTTPYLAGMKHNALKRNELPSMPTGIGSWKAYPTTGASTVSGRDETTAMSNFISKYAGDE
jgi:hypothetical protein